jgi:hypothetical protein
MNRPAFGLGARVVCALASLVSSVTLGGGAAFAQARPQASPPAAVTAEAQREAAERFNRGLDRFNNGDNAGALAEFQRAYQIAPNVLVLYNLGLVYAQMGNAVEATDKLDAVLAEPAGKLSPERLAIARRTRDEQAARIAELAVTTSVDGATVSVDGIEVGTTPLPRPIRVTSGEHVIGALAPGFAPKTVAVIIASREKQVHRLELVATKERVAHLAVKTHLPGAAVFSDNERIGTTPVSVSMPLQPGAHHIELRRPGYVTARTDVTLADGATGEVILEPAEDATELATIGGAIALQIDEPDASVVLDGQSRGAYVAPLRVAPGPHHVVVVTPNFEPFERDVTVESRGTSDVRVVLIATPEFRAKFASHARSRRAWSIITAVAGAALAGGGVGVLVYDGKLKTNATATLNALPSTTPHSMTFCDPGNATSPYLCGPARSEAQTNQSTAQTLDYVAWSALGVGGAAIVLGAILLITSDSPHAYDAPVAAKSSGTARPLPAVPTFWASPGAGGLGLVGSF